MQFAKINGITVHYADIGPRDGFPVVFANSLGTDLRVWDKVIPLLPEGLRIVTYDKRGHGLTDAPRAPYFMGDLVQDAAALLDFLRIKGCAFVGLSVGGIIAQGLAAERPDLVGGMVLSNTAAKIGTPERWQARIDSVRKDGIAAIADNILDLWFTKTFRETNPEELSIWKNMLSRTPVEGYVGCCAAIAETDLLESTARLTLPTLVIAGAEDGSTPPDLVRETAELVRDHEFHVIRKAGHIPGVEQPAIVAELISAFVEKIRQ